ncbi:MAG TPA: iron ABC transporter permease [Trebonia sp.]
MIWMTRHPAGRPATVRPSSRRENPVQAVIWLLVLGCVLVPVLPLLYASVQSKPVYDAGRAFTLSAYSQLFSDPAFWAAARNTAEFAAITTVCSVALGSGFAVLCARSDVLGRRGLGPLIAVPVLLPPLGVILGWNALYGPGGYAHPFITAILPIPFNLTSVPGMAVLGTATAVPVVFLVCQAALAGMDASLENAGRSVGAGAGRVLSRVTLPMLRPALINSGLLVFTLSIESLGIPLVLGSPQGHDFIASYLYGAWSNAVTPDPPSVSAGATILLAAACGLLWLRSRLIGDEARFVSVGGRSGSADGTVRLGRRARVLLGGLMALYLAATTVAPLVALAVESAVSQLTPLIAPWHLLTAANWTAIAHGEYIQSIRNSALIALVGAAATTVLVALATAVAHRSRFALRRSLPFLLLFPRAVPGLIVGIGFFWSFLLVNPPGHALLNSVWGLTLALSVRSMTLAYFVLSAAVAAVSTSLDDAGRSAGAGWWTTITRITLPILRPAVFVAFILMFVSILNDYDPALFLATPGTTVMGVAMLNAEAQGVNGPVAAMAVVQVAVTVIAIAAGGRLFAARPRRGSA